MVEMERQQVPPKSQYLSIKLNGFTLQMTIIFIFKDMATSNLFTGEPLTTGPT
jgi:hypothetical protein